MRIANTYNLQPPQNITKTVAFKSKVFGGNIADTYTSSENTVKPVYKKFSKDLRLDVPIQNSSKKSFDVNKSHYFQERDDWDNRCYQIYFNPEVAGQLIDKKTKKPIDVYIIKTTNPYYHPDTTGFNFISKDLDKSYGRVMITKDVKKERIIINWLENYNDEEIGGVGKLADKVAAKHCVENNLPFNIVSSAVTDSMIAHYKRGKRYLPVEKDSKEYKFLMEKFGISDVNEILANMIKQSEETSKKADLSIFNDFQFLMILPKELAKKYAEEEYTPIIQQPKKSWFENFKGLFGRMF